MYTIRPSAIHCKFVLSTLRESTTTRLLPSMFIDRISLPSKNAMRLAAPWDVAVAVGITGGGTGVSVCVGTGVDVSVLVADEVMDAVLVDGSTGVK